MTPRFVVDDRVPPPDPEPPPGGWQKPTCRVESHKWAIEIESGLLHLVCRDPCDTALHDPSAAPAVCQCDWLLENLMTPDPLPVALTYVDDSTPSTPNGPAEYGFYIEVLPA